MCKRFFFVLAISVCFVVKTFAASAEELCTPGTWKEEAGKTYICPVPGWYFLTTLDKAPSQRQWQEIANSQRFRVEPGKVYLYPGSRVVITCNSKQPTMAHEKILIHYNLTSGKWAPGDGKVGPALCE